jgi:hypothetical protein
MSDRDQAKARHTSGSQRSNREHTEIRQRSSRDQGADKTAFRQRLDRGREVTEINRDQAKIRERSGRGQTARSDRMMSNRCKDVTENKQRPLPAFCLILT